MLSISIGELLTLVLILPLAGGIVGYVVAGDRMRRSAGGRSPAELRAEHEAYRGGVTEHFQETAELLNRMTAQYREVYTHMARGAAEFCDTAEQHAALEDLRRTRFALDDAAAPAAEAAGADEEAAPEPPSPAASEEGAAAPADLAASAAAEEAPGDADDDLGEGEPAPAATGEPVLGVVAGTPAAETPAVEETQTPAPRETARA
ncbi:MAG: YhcB family protein [Gammaproteobacteria bacterium]